MCQCVAQFNCIRILIKEKKWSMRIFIAYKLSVLGLIHKKVFSVHCILNFELYGIKQLSLPIRKATFPKSHELKLHRLESFLGSASAAE